MGDPHSMRGLADQLAVGSEQERARARSLIEKAAELGDADALAKVGDWYEKGEGVTKDPKAALQYHERAAMAGYSGAEAKKVGTIYLEGTLVERDYAAARRWLEVAAKRNQLDAMVDLGVIYQNGWGLPALDEAKAEEWFDRSTRRKGPETRQVADIYEAGKRVPRDLAKAAKWYELAVSRGDRDSNLNLGRLYSNGHGVDRDHAKAHRYFERAVNNEHALVARNIGLMFFRATGVERDLARAKIWLEKAAELGGGATNLIDIAIVHLAEDNQRGYPRAREFFERAIDAGGGSVAEEIGQLFLNGKDVVAEGTRAIEWLERAAKLEQTAALTTIGGIYHRGEAGVAKDLSKARAYYLKAIEGKDTEAMMNMGRLVVAEQGSKGHPEARKYFQMAAEAGVDEGADNLRRLDVSDASEAGKHDVALRLQAAHAKIVEERETAANNKPGPQTVDVLGSVSWYALFAREPQLTLEAAERALSLDPSQLWIATNRASALMFLGRPSEAKALFLAHKDKIVEMNNKLWQEVIADDFDQFRKAGLTHELMEEIERELGVAKK